MAGKKTPKKQAAEKAARNVTPPKDTPSKEVKPEAPAKKAEDTERSNFRGHQMLSAKDLIEMLGSDSVKVSVTRRSVKDALTAKSEQQAAETLKKFS